MARPCPHQVGGLAASRSPHSPWAALASSGKRGATGVRAAPRRGYGQGQGADDLTTREDRHGHATASTWASPRVSAKPVPPGVDQLLVETTSVGIPRDW